MDNQNEQPQATAQPVEALTKHEIEDTITAIRVAINPASRMFFPRGWNVLLNKLQAMLDGAAHPAQQPWEKLTQWGAAGIAIGWQEDNEMYVKVSDLRCVAYPAQQRADGDERAQDRRALELANAALIASKPEHEEGWTRHEAAINATACALHKPAAQRADSALPVVAVADRSELRQAVRKALKHHKLTLHGDGVVEADMCHAVVDAIAALQQAASQPAAAAQGEDARDPWQPIATAPHDELLLLAYEFDRPGDWRIKVGGYWNGEWEVFGASWTPTRWMPMPATPIASDYERRRAAFAAMQANKQENGNG